MLVLALLDGVGIPLALGDPEITPDSATADVLAALAVLLGRDDRGPGGLGDDDPGQEV